MKEKCILIIEDSWSILHALNIALRPKGYKILEAINGKEGLNTALIAHPDLILLDLVLPEMEGMLVLEELRKNVWGANVPVLIISNLDDVEKFYRSKELGVIDYIIKSNISIREITNKIESILK